MRRAIPAYTTDLASNILANVSRDHLRGGAASRLRELRCRYVQPVRIRRSRRESNEVDAVADEGITKLVRVFCISVENQIPRVAKETSSASVTLRAICFIQRLSG
jgi:hypothetical protein